MNAITPDRFFFRYRQWLTRTLVVGGLLTGISVYGHAEGEVLTPQDMIEIRQQGFKKMGAAIKTCRDELRASEPDQAKLLAAAQSLDALADKIGDWFPTGTGPDTGIKTDALPYIWKNPEKFTSISAQLPPATQDLLAAVAANDKSALATQVKAVIDVCSACHRSFRAD